MGVGDTTFFGGEEVIRHILILVNAVAFCVYGIDKYRARHGKYRISERTLLLLAAAGGAWGAYAAMQLFRHKTRHKKFAAGVPILAVIQTAAYILVLRAYH